MFSAGHRPSAQTLSCIDAGRSAGRLEEILFPSTMTSSSGPGAPALIRGSLMKGNPVIRPLMMFTDASIQLPWQTAAVTPAVSYPPCTTLGPTRMGGGLASRRCGQWIPQLKILVTVFDEHRDLLCPRTSLRSTTKDDHSPPFGGWYATQAAVDRQAISWQSHERSARKALLLTGVN